MTTILFSLQTSGQLLNAENSTSIAFLPNNKETSQKKVEIGTNQLVLYYFEECPYCQKVLRFLQNHPDYAAKITFKDINTHPTAENELMKIGGKTQVPCLCINNKALYESNDIIEWLKNNLNTPK